MNENTRKSGMVRESVVLSITLEDESVHCFKCRNNFRNLLPVFGEIFSDWNVEQYHYTICK